MIEIHKIAWTHLDDRAAFAASDYQWEPEGRRGSDLIEMAGRACYQSWDRPNPATAANADYVKHIMQVEHFSLLYHPVLTVYISGISRNCTHELIRHHVGTAYSQLSQRYVDAGDMDYVVAPALREDTEAKAILHNAWNEAIMDYRQLCDNLEAEGYTRKQAREAARAVLPGMTETKIVVSGNYAAWRNFVLQRGGVHADAEIRELAVAMAYVLKEHDPNPFWDITIGTTHLKNGKEIAVVSVTEEGRQ